MSPEDPEHELSETELNELISQLESDEQASLESTLESEVSFRSWINSNPAMRQMLIPEKISDIVPVMLKFLRFMLGLDKEPSHIMEPDLDDDGDESR